jgi:proteasome lid subunit RPN8/RPN11
MKAKAKLAPAQPEIAIDSEVVRMIRQHARSSNKTEVCGILIGQDRERRVQIAACIEGENAEGAGAHVTFTQDTWEHIYSVKDKQYPDDRIVGWYHSHPGFGIFLSEHDTFIHKNFFSSPGQIAWVYDPHSDEEGCFGWVDGQIERLSRVSVLDRRGGEPADAIASSETAETNKTDSHAANENDTPDRSSVSVQVRRTDIEREDDGHTGSLERLVANVFLYLAALALGGLLSWYFFPHVVIMPVLVDPVTAKPLDPEVAAHILDEWQAERAGKATPADSGQDAAQDGSGKKGDDTHAK